MMYDFFINLIGHQWDYNAPSYQGYVYTGCVVLICLLTVFVAKLFVSWLSYVLNIFRH